MAALNSRGVIGSGGHVFFRGGDTFAGPLVLQLAGTADAPCVLTSYASGMATLTDATPFDRPICELHDSQYVTVERLRFVGTPGVKYPGPDFRPVNHAPGLSIRSTRSTGTRLRDIDVHNCEFRNTFSGLWISCDFSKTIDGFDGVNVTENVFDADYQFGCYVIGYDALKGGPVDQIRNVSIRSNTFADIRGDPHFDSESQPVGVTSATGVLIDQNRFRDNCGFGGLVAGTPVGGSTALSVSNCRRFWITGNEVTATHCDRRFDGSAIDVDQDSRDGEIDHNVTYLNDGPGIQLGSFGGSLTGDIAIHHNVSINDVRGCQPDSVQGSVRFWGNTDHTVLYNNTIVVTAGGCRGTPSCVSVEAPNNNSGIAAVNNIFKTTGGLPMIRPNGSRPGEYDPAHVDASCRFLANCYDSSGARLLICTDDTHGQYRDITTAGQWNAAGQELRNGTPCGLFGDAGLLSPLTFRAPERGFFTNGLPEIVTYLGLKPTSLCRQGGVDVGPYLPPISINQPPATYSPLGAIEN